MIYRKGPMHATRLSFPVCLLTSLLMSATASAQVEGGGGDVSPVSTAPAGKDAVQRGVQGPAGMVHARVLLHVNASKDNFGDPVSLAPDLFYAVTDTVQIGLLHNRPMGFQTRPGAGICFTGTPNCRKVYDNVGFDLMYGLAFGDFHFSAHSSLYLTQISDPTLAMLTVGAAGKLHFTDTVGLFFDPQIGIGLSNRDRGNEEQLFVPLELQFQLAPSTSLKFLTGITGHFSNLGDNYEIPVGIGAVYNVSTSMDLGLRFSFDNLLGAERTGVGRADVRSLALLLHIRF
jgi:hypothetical protein